MIQTKVNDYFNMIINWYKMKYNGLEDYDILENIEDIYSICVEQTTESKCTISG
jgi:hypothetical protein